MKTHACLSTASRDSTSFKANLVRKVYNVYLLVTSIPVSVVFNVLACTLQASDLRYDTIVCIQRTVKS